MLLSEHQAKELLTQYGLRVPDGRLATTPKEVEVSCKEINAKKYVVKAQIAAGGRGLAGGIKFAATPSAAADEARKILGSNLVTEQTSLTGETVNSVYVEAAVDISKSFYVALALEPKSGLPILLASSVGGVEFEQRAQMDEDIVKTHPFDQDTSEQRAALVAFLGDIGIKGDAVVDALLSARQAFLEYEMTLLEINPLALTADNSWVVIDAKVTLDNNAAFRHPEFEGLGLETGSSASELEAQKHNINLVNLTGNIGVVSNGAGLGLATHDMIVDSGGAPANFMDIRTTAQSFDVAKGVELLLGDPKVNVVLLVVHGGGMTTADTIAEGVNFAYARSDRELPVIAYISGQNAEWGIKILRERKVPVTTFDTISGAIAEAVAVAKNGGAR